MRHFTWTYSFVASKRHYTNAYSAFFTRQTYRTTVAHTSNEHQILIQQWSESLKTVLNPVAVAMDLAKAYHTFCQEWFSRAIRIADRFHVNRYVTEALQDVRRMVQKDLSSHAKKKLKANARLLKRSINTNFRCNKKSSSIN
ncbi:transposase [Halalkalibacterium ligniniphilum]|uniref:transposase n=1 Tax=Halalkalibacterium ligniniphilum TaxID=1134413 RepID=UPI00034ACBDA|nr:transposase [Halalkalibacterium ligniniphilum]